jgi:hypothetical protein
VKQDGKEEKAWVRRKGNYNLPSWLQPDLWNAMVVDGVMNFIFQIG